MEEQIKKIVSQFIKIPVEQITAHTVIDRSAVSSSIILHRMYAQLTAAGLPATDHTQIKNFGQLLAIAEGKAIEASAGEEDPLQQDFNTADEPSIGIDIENTDSLPRVTDFREHEFYKMNFAPSEIAYCILQPDPYASFAGLFAAKEAIVKANNYYKSKPFNNIVIDHLPSGKPAVNGFLLSITHSGQTAIAVAVSQPGTVQGSQPLAVEKNSSSSFTAIAAVAALILSLIAVLLLLFRH